MQAYRGGELAAYLQGLLIASKPPIVCPPRCSGMFETRGALHPIELQLRFIPPHNHPHRSSCIVLFLREEILLIYLSMIYLAFYIFYRKMLFFMRREYQK
jgi:hypothetical protein